MGVKLATEGIEEPLEGEEVVKIVKLPDGTKQLFFRFDKLKGNSDSPTLENIYEEVKNILLSKTNFDQLPNQNSYLTVIVKLLQAAYFGRSVDPQTQVVFQALANELEFVNEQSEIDYLTGELEEEFGDESEPEKEKSVIRDSVAGTVQIIEGEGQQEVEVISVSGVGVKVKAKVAKPVTVKVDSSVNDPNIAPYADLSDFEETGGNGHVHRQGGKEGDLTGAGTVKSENIHKSAIKDDTQTIQGHNREKQTINVQIVENTNKEKVLPVNEQNIHEKMKYLEEQNIDFSIFEDELNPELMDGLKQVIQDNNLQHQTGSVNHEADGSVKEKTSQKQEVPEHMEVPKVERTVQSLKQDSEDKKSRN